MMDFSCRARAGWRCPSSPTARPCVAEVAYGPAGAAVSVDGAAPAADAVAIAAADAVYVLRRGRQTKVTLRDLALDQAGDAGQGGLVRAPMHGKVLPFWSSRARR